MLLALALCPAMLGTHEAIRQSQQKQRRERHRARRCSLLASCVKHSTLSRAIDGRPIVLRDNKLYIDTANLATLDSHNDPPTAPNPLDRPCHHFSGYFLPYPDSNHEGLVSTISEAEPVLNWIFVDKDTHEVKYGVRADAQAHLTGPFDCTEVDRRLTLEGWEGFVAVEEEAGVWAVYFDRVDDGLEGKAGLMRVCEVELWRREVRVRAEVAGSDGVDENGDWGEGKTRSKEEDQSETRELCSQQRQLHTREILHGSMDCDGEIISEEERTTHEESGRPSDIQRNHDQSEESKNAVPPLVLSKSQSSAVLDNIAAFEQQQASSQVKYIRRRSDAAEHVLQDRRSRSASVSQKAERLPLVQKARSHSETMGAGRDILPIAAMLLKPGASCSAAHQGFEVLVLELDGERAEFSADMKGIAEEKGEKDNVHSKTGAHAVQGGARSLGLGTGMRVISTSSVVSDGDVINEEASYREHDRIGK